MNVFHFLLELIGIPLESPALYRVIESLSKAVGECGIAIGKAGESQNADYFEGVVDDESAVIENLLGAAFVTCQANITGIVSHVKRIHKEAQAQGFNLTSSNGSKEGILSIGGVVVQGSPFTQVQVIDAFANYFKHCDEWGPWQNLAGNQKQTMDIISKMGANEFNTENLRTGVEALGISDCGSLEPLAEYVSTWVKAVRRAYETELKQHQLL